MRQFILSAAAILAVLPMFACSQRHGEEKPDTQSVKGKVVLKGNRSFTEGGQLELLHTEKAGVSARSEIAKDGSFELYTMTAQQKMKGAMEGPYSVKIIVSGADQNVKILEPQKKYTIAKGENDLTIVADD